MSITNLIKEALMSIKTRKLRVFLTMIGIIIGISSVVTILSIGNGLKAEVTKSAQDSSSSKIQITFESESQKSGYQGANDKFTEPFDKQDILELTKVDGVQKVEPNKGMFGSDSVSSAVTYFDKTTNLFINKYDNKELHVKYGRAFGENDTDFNLIVLSNDDATNLFTSPEKAIDKGININGTMFQVIGVLEKKNEMSLGLNAPSSTLIQKHSMDAINGESSFNSINVYIDPTKDKEKVFEELKNKLELSHKELKGEYKLEDPEQITKIFEKLIGGVTLFITLVTGISLLVGGIGVMNIMYVSVTERRKEIGIRRAIGAKPKSIMLQFLFEAIIVTMMGGIAGIVMGCICSNIAGAFMPFKPVLTIGTFAGATLTSVITGIIFGIMPAYNASKLDPIKAIYK